MARPRLSRGVYSFEELQLAPPRDVVLDTSFVVEALVPQQPLRSACLDYMLRLAEADSSITFSRLLEVELAEAAFQLGLKERHPRDWKRYRTDGRARRSGARYVAQVAEAWDIIVDAFPSRCVELAAVVQDVPDLMARYGLASYDAVHVATAIHAGVRGVVTLDAGFAAAPASLVELYVDGSRVSSCRRRRVRK